MKTDLHHFENTFRNVCNTFDPGPKELTEKRVVTLLSPRFRRHVLLHMWRDAANIVLISGLNNYQLSLNISLQT